MSQNRMSEFIPKVLAVLLAFALCFGFAPAVFAMEGAEAEIPGTEEPENPETTEEEKPKITSGSCGINLSWSFSGGTLTISGSGAMTDFPESTMAPWYGIRKEILRIVLPEGLTSIGYIAFYECKNVISVTVPDSVKKIGGYAFAHCEGMKIVNLGKGVETIGEGAFSDCYAVSSFKLPSGLKTIGKKAFYRCESITSVTVPSSVTEIGVAAFGYCVSLVSANIQARITEIPTLMFYACHKLSSVTLPDTMENLGYDVFDECDCLSTVYYNGENVSPEELQEEIGKGTVSEGSPSTENSGGVVLDNGDGTITFENTTVTEGEDSTVSTTTGATLSSEGEIIESTEPEVTVNISGESGWEEAEGVVEDILKNYGTADDGSEKHINLNLFVQGTESISQEFIEAIAGKDVTVTITTENGSVWIINGKDIDTAQLSGNYNLAYVLEAGSPELCEKLGTGTSFVLKFLAPAEINAEVLIRIGGNYAGQNASLFKGGKNVEKVQSVVVDSEGYAHFYLGSVTEKTEYYIGMNVPGASEEAIIPQNMLAEYGNPEYIEPIKYEITGRSSSWGMNLGQVMSILAAVMVTVMIVVGAVMFFWNKQRLKNGYVPQMDDEDE